jgi:hypothetical protein
VRSASDFGFCAPASFTSLAHSSRPARSFATSMKKFMPMAQKNDSRGANLSTSIPASLPAFRYSMPSARV